MSMLDGRLSENVVVPPTLRPGRPSSSRKAGQQRVNWSSGLPQRRPPDLWKVSKKDPVRRPRTALANPQSLLPVRPLTGTVYVEAQIVPSSLAPPGSWVTLDLQIPGATEMVERLPPEPPRERFVARCRDMRTDEVHVHLLDGTPHLSKSTADAVLMKTVFPLKDVLVHAAGVQTEFTVGLRCTVRLRIAVARDAAPEPPPEPPRRSSTPRPPPGPPRCASVMPRSWMLGRIERGKTPENPPPPRAVAEALLFFVYSTVAEPPPRPPSREVLASRVAELEAELEATRGSPSGARRPGRNVRLEPGATSELADAIAALRAADTGDAAVASAAVALIVLIQCAWRRALAYRRARRKLAVRAAHHYRRVLAIYFETAARIMRPQSSPPARRYRRPGTPTV